MALDLYPKLAPYTKRPINASDVGQLVDYLTRELGGVERGVRDARLVPTRTVTTDTTMSLSDGLMLVDATGGAVTVTLPALPASGGLVFRVKKVDSSGNAVTVSAAEDIDGGSVTLSAQYDGVILIGDAVTYHVVGTPQGTDVGDVVGPASSTDNAVARFNGTTGKLLQNSVVTVSDTGAIAGAASLTVVNTGFTSAYAANALGSYVNAFGATSTYRVLIDSAVAATFGAGGTFATVGLATLASARVTNLAGVGTRYVGADADGDLVITTTPTGDVVGPASATDNAIARYNLTTGKLIQNSSATISDAGQLDATSYAVGGTPGDSDTIDTAAGTWTIIVSGGLITSIVQTS